MPVATPETPPCFDIRGLTKVYGSGEAAVHALRGVDLSIPDGRINGDTFPFQRWDRELTVRVVDFSGTLRLEAAPDRANRLILAGALVPYQCAMMLVAS